MEALVSSYGESSSSDSDSSSPLRTADSHHLNSVQVEQEEESNRLPPPPLDLLNPPNSQDCSQTGGSRVRSFPHVEGNYALHVSIPDSQIDGRSSGNLLWTEGMDRVLVSTLQKQLSLGNKSKYGWKSIAYTAVINNMWRKQHMKIKKDHIRSRLKTWRKMHAAVKEMLALGGFRWDDNSKTMKASEHVWRDVLKTRKHLRQYKGKSLGFYQEISQLVGEDHAEGVQGSTPVMTTGNMAAANEAQVDPLGEDIHLEDWSPRNINSQIPLPMHAPMSTGPSGAYAQPQRQHTQSLTTGLHN